MLDDTMTISNVLWIIGVSVFVVLFWAAIDTLPEVVAEIRRERTAKRAERLAAESSARYEEARLKAWQEKNSETTMSLKVVSIPQQTRTSGSHRRVA